MFGPGEHSERDVLVGFLGEQLAALRTAAHGLTDEQARTRPLRSALSVGGLLKHAAWVLSRHTSAPVGEPGAPLSPDFAGSFALGEDETLDATRARFDEVAAAFLAAARATDPAGAVTAPPAPWHGVDAPTPSVSRYELVHLVEELARHAGHADLLREELDGATALPLLMAVEGLPGNAYVQPWAPTA